MRRVSNKQTISPQQLKHFAAVAVVLTGLLAFFTSGEDWGAQAQVSAIEQKNQLVETETQKLGTKKLGSALAASQKNTTSFEEMPAGSPVDAAPQFVASSYSGPQQPMLQPPPGASDGQIDRRQMPTRPGQSVTMKSIVMPGQKGRILPKAQAGPVDAQQTAAINAVSRERGGSADQRD